MTWLKICGITRVADAVCCRDAGADAIGFVFAPSPRQVSFEQAHQICRAVPDIIKVGVFVDAPLMAIQELRCRLGLDVIQLHGGETNEYCRQLGGAVIKALRPKSAVELQQMDRYIDVWKILVDAYDPGRMGGTGVTVTSEILDHLNDLERIILAGGIGPENAGDILSSYSPFGLDCSSRLESSAGIKSHEKIISVCQQVKGAHYEK
jgi:phosphoribosylanthranilate isomerase